MFIGREGELDSLNRLYASNKYEFAVIYGHRRVGKTALITQFIKDKKAIYFMGVESNARQNLENFSKNILKFGAGIPVEAAFVFFNLHWNMFLSWRKALGLIQKETSYGEKVSRKSIYTIADNMFRFWYRFVPENHSIIGRGAADLAYRRIEPHLSDYMGKVFEEICKQYLWRLLLAGKSPVEFRELGRWRGTNPATRKQAEIDIMGEQDKDTALFGECKWTNEKVDVGVLETLAERSQMFRYGGIWLYLFAKNGFTKGCADAAEKMGNVRLVSYRDILEDNVLWRKKQENRQ